MVSSNITAYILAGGTSKRMGRDKRLIEIGGRSFLQRACALVEDTLGRKPVIVGDNIGDVSESYETLPDALPGKGPLGGLVSCLRHCNTEWALILAVDTPFLSVEEIEGLIESIADGFDVIAYTSEEGIEPLGALYKVETETFWAERLEADELSLARGITALRFKTLKIAAGSRGLFNLNTPEDIAKFSDY